MEKIREQLKKVVKLLFDTETEIELTVAPVETGADYACNVAMRLAKVAHKAPLQIAEEIQRELEKAELLEIERIEVAAPGFLNLRLSAGYLKQKANELVASDAQFLRKMPDTYDGKMVVTEFSDPNPFKVLHVGHLYTSVVGDSISRLLELAGAEVKRVNFGGDVGLHVGKTIWVLLQDQEKWQNLTIEQIAHCYVMGTQAYEEDETAKQEITTLNKIVYALAELGQDKSYERLQLEKVAEDFERPTAEIATIAELYWQGRTLSYEYFKDFYAQIGVKFDKFYPESTVVDKGLTEVREHTGEVYEESKGAIVYKGEKVGLHTRVFINRDGVPTYETKDVGLIFTKWADWHFDESVVITGNEQTDYMKVVLASVAEYAPELVERTRHLTHGLVKLKGGVKMSSRKGNFLRAVDVLEMVRGILAEKNDGEVDEKVVLAAVKYAFLKYKMGGDIIFDPEESVSTTGNSGVYLLYSTVRAKKILQKIGERRDLQKVDEKREKTCEPVENPVENSKNRVEMLTFERGLYKKIVQFEEVLSEAVLGKAPYKVCNYLYELAQEFSRFYEHEQVVGGERETELGEIVRIYADVMVKGLGLLGIEVPERM